jgi:phage/plasmid primase-like uncharacterized protein
MAACPVCEGKQRIVVVDDDEGTGNNITSSTEPEHCTLCGNLRDTVTIHIIHEQVPYGT